MAKNKNNTRNPASPLFKRLTRMLSGPIVNYRTQVARQEKRADLDKYRYRFRSMSGQEFKRHDSNMSQNYNLFTSAAFRNQNRAERYTDFEQMEYMPEIATALDIYADEMTTSNEYDRLLNIDCLNHEIKTILESLFYDVLNIEFNCFGWARSMCKYGDFFLGLEIAEGKGIVNVTPHSVYNTERLERTDPSNPNSVKFKITEDPNGKQEYENFEIAHFRLLSDTNWLPYGKSMLENGRRLWKQLSLMEDAMLIHRIMRAPEKRVFKIDIGNIPPTEVDNYMQRIINKMKKVPFIDKNTGDYNLKYNMQNLTEDFYLPVRGGDSGTSIDNLAGLEAPSIDDIDYLKNKMFAALKIPRAYLGYEENVNGKATLAAEDVRFARTIERIQRTVISELSKIAIVHLYAQGITDSEMTNFELQLVNPSTIYEQEKVNLWSEKIRLAQDIQGLNMLSKDWVYENIFKLSNGDQDIQRVKMLDDLKDRFRFRSIEDEGNDPATEDEEPDDIEESIEKIKQEILSVDEVQSVHDIHVWSLDGEHNVLTCHVVLKNCTVAETKEVKENIEGHMKSFHINHTTIECEIEGECVGKDCVA